jgi:hypothetical protein
MQYTAVEAGSSPVTAPFPYFEMALLKIPNTLNLSLDYTGTIDRERSDDLRNNS